MGRLLKTLQNVEKAFFLGTGSYPLRTPQAYYFVLSNDIRSSCDSQKYRITMPAAQPRTQFQSVE